MPRKRTVGCMPFPKIFVLCEIQAALSRIWTQVAVSISDDDNRYTEHYVESFKTRLVGWKPGLKTYKSQEAKNEFQEYTCHFFIFSLSSSWSEWEGVTLRKIGFGRWFTQSQYRRQAKFSYPALYLNSLLLTFLSLTTHYGLLLKARTPSGMSHILLTIHSSRNWSDYLLVAPLNKYIQYSGKRKLFFLRKPSK